MKFIIKSPVPLTDSIIKSSGKGGMPDEPDQKRHHGEKISLVRKDLFQSLPKLKSTAA